MSNNDAFPNDAQILVGLLREKTLADARERLLRRKKNRPKAAMLLAGRLVALRPADGADIADVMSDVVAMLDGAGEGMTDTIKREMLARVRVWSMIGTGELPAYGNDMFAVVDKCWPGQLGEVEPACRQGTSPIVAVLLQENAVEAAEAAINALADAKAFGVKPWLTKRWVTDRVLNRIGADGQLAREASREVAATLADAGMTELSICFQLLGATPRNQMSFWSLYANIFTLSLFGQLGELSADEAKSMTQAIAVLQLCAEGVYAAEMKSLWEILKPMLRDEVNEPEFPAVRQPWPRPLPPLRPRGPSMVVVRSAPKLRPEAVEFKDLIGAEVALVVARGLAGVRNVLRGEYPHAMGAIDLLLRDVTEGKPVVVKPTLLVGPPGTGKSRLARRFAELLGLHALRFDAASSTDGQFAGVSKGWHSTMPSVPLRAIQQGGKANPVVLLDEIEKAATSNHNGSLFASLTAFLERETSKRYRDQSLDAECDLSMCSYLATANDDTLLPPHIRDRFRVVRVELPSLQHLPLLAMNVVADIERQDGIQGFVEPLAPDELAVIGDAWKRARFSMRALQKIIQATLDARAAFQMRH